MVGGNSCAAHESPLQSVPTGYFFFFVSLGAGFFVPLEPPFLQAIVSSCVGGGMLRAPGRMTGLRGADVS